MCDKKKITGHILRWLYGNVSIALTGQLPGTTSLALHNTYYISMQSLLFHYKSFYHKISTFQPETLRVTCEMSALASNIILF